MYVVFFKSLVRPFLSAIYRRAAGEKKITETNVTGDCDWNWNAILMKLSPLAAAEDIVSTTFGEDNDEIYDISIPVYLCMAPVSYADHDRMGAKSIGFYWIFYCMIYWVFGYTTNILQALNYWLYAD